MTDREQLIECSVAGCGRELFSQKSGLCRPHYRRLQKYGNVESGPKIVDRSMSTEDRFWSKVVPTGFCWEWTGRTQKRTGHGRFSPTHSTTIGAHRFAYELLVGPVPDGQQLDHLCRNPPCVNPDHLEPVTARENVLRGFGITADQSRRIRCPAGHEYTPENTRVSKRGFRNCRACARVRASEWAKEKVECPRCRKMLTRKNMKRHKATMHA